MRKKKVSKKKTSKKKQVGKGKAIILLSVKRYENGIETEINATIGDLKRIVIDLVNVIKQGDRRQNV